MTRLVAHLKAIDLDELNALASLQTRVDRKYVVSVAALGQVLADLDGDSRALEIDGVRGSQYESVYFDTDSLESYQAAAHRRRRRFKVRTRAYLDSADCYLEVKTRGGRSLTVKERIAHPSERRSRLTREGVDYVDSALADAGIDAVGADNATTGEQGARALHPTMVTRYKRTTLFVPARVDLPGTASRATIDVDLSWTTTDRRGVEGTTLATPGLAIIETKSGSTSSRVDRVLWSHGIRPVNISKYGVGMAAIHPGLPSNKWHRVLEGQLLPAAAPPSPALSHPDQRT